MSFVKYNPDILPRILSRFTDILSDKPNIRALAEVIAPEMQQLEDMWFQLLNERSLDVGIGAQLDVVGNILNEPRLGKNDDEYRQALRLKIALNTSDGTNDDVRQAVTQLTQSTTVFIDDNYPASVDIIIDGNNISGDILQTIDNVVGAGIGVNIQSTTVDRFAFTDTPDGVIIIDDPEGFGFADTDGITVDGTNAGNLVDNIF